MAFLFQDQNQGIRNDVGPRAKMRGRRKPFSFIRTVTVGFGITPNLLTLLPGREGGARGLGLRHPYRRWGFSPRPENIGRPEWTTWLENMTKAGASASAFAMGKRHVPMPPEQGASELPDAELHPRFLLRGLVEAEIDLRAGKSEVSQLPVIEAAQCGQRRLALATRDFSDNQAV